MLAPNMPFGGKSNRPRIYQSFVLTYDQQASSRVDLVETVALKLWMTGVSSNR